MEGDDQGKSARVLRRRDFLRAAGSAATLAVLSATVPGAAATAGRLYRRLGRTELMVSELGIGCSPIGQRQDRDSYRKNTGAVMRLG